MSSSTSDNIDSDMSRQIYALGKETQLRIMSSSVLVVGVDTLGVEVAKNLLLMGVRTLGVFDETPVTKHDIDTNIALDASSPLGKPRSECCRPYLAKLSPTSVINIVKKIDAEGIEPYNVVVLADCVDYKRAVEIDEMCRRGKTPKSFVWGATCGTATLLFSDFGPKHVVMDQTGENPELFLIQGVVPVEGKKTAQVVIVEEGQLPDFDVGDYIKFSGVEEGSMVELNKVEPVKVVEKNGKYMIEVELDVSGFHPFENSAYIERVKMPRTMEFKTLAERIAEPGEIQETNFCDFGRERQLFAAFMTLGKFMETHDGKRPRVHNREDAEEFKKLFAEFEKEHKIDPPSSDDFAIVFAMTSSGMLPAFATYLGGIVCQEALKACSGKYTPVFQWMFYDDVDVLPKDFVSLPEAEFVCEECPFSDQVNVIGKRLQQLLENKKTFLVGAGAIGCEVLKTIGMMGVGTGADGLIHLTDMDAIERSNLARQFLFRSGDVGRLKSEVAAEAVRRMVPGIKIKTYSIPVGKDTEDMFNHQFWESLDFVLNALDNIKARLYVDGQCVAHQKALLDSGTLGPKGNTQSVIPFMTENYGASRDPEEKSIPLCTLHNFPNNVDHTIAWAMDQFKGIFTGVSEGVSAYVKSESFLDSLGESSQDKFDAVKLIYDALVKRRPRDFKDCVCYARQLFEDNFVTKIKKLLSQFPPDHVTAEGHKFWSPPKRCPEPLVFDSKNKTQIDFITAVANIRAFMFKIPQRPTLTSEEIDECLRGFEVEVFKETEEKKEETGEDTDAELAELVKKLPDRKTLEEFEMPLVEFEKDDDTNFHVAYVTACSNLRATNYAIPEADFQKTKMIAGKIIPAMISTTALVSGLQCLELIKVIQVEDKTIDSFRSSFANIAIPLFVFQSPLPCEEKEVCPGVKTSMWTSFNHNAPKDETIGQFIDAMKKKFGVKVESITYGAVMLFADFMLKGKALEDRLKMTMKQAYSAVAKKELPADKECIELCLDCVTAEGEEEIEEFPAIKYFFA